MTEREYNFTTPDKIMNLGNKTIAPNITERKKTCKHYALPEDSTQYLQNCLAKIVGPQSF